MDLFTVNPLTFARHTIIDEYESLVWTERFIEPGDTQLVLPATRDSVKLVKPGTLLGMSTSKEYILLDTRSIEDGLVTVTGKTLEAFFDQRYVGPMTITDEPGQIMKQVVQEMQSGSESPWDPIDGLYIGAVADFEGLEVTEKIPRGSVHSILLTLAKKYNVGMAVYVVTDIFGQRQLEFTTWLGQDKTDQIMFAPELDNFANIKELNTEAEAKTYVLVYPPTELAKTGELADGMPPVDVDNIDDADETNPFARRILEYTSELTEDDLVGPDDAAKLTDLENKMLDKARDLLYTDHKKIRAVDGEITPESQYKYYTQFNPDGDPEFRLGDEVQTAGHFTSPVQGILSEYIQTADTTGRRAYPTISQPAGTGVEIG